MFVFDAFDSGDHGTNGWVRRTTGRAQPGYYVGIIRIEHHQVFRVTWAEEGQGHKHSQQFYPSNRYVWEGLLAWTRGDQGGQLGVLQ